VTVNTNPIHFGEAYAARTEFKRPFVDSTFIRPIQVYKRDHAPAGFRPPRPA